MKKFAFSSASVNDWRDAVVTATNREEAGKKNSGKNRFFKSLAI